jgi:hypothetical protein
MQETARIVLVIDLVAGMGILEVEWRKFDAASVCGAEGWLRARVKKEEAPV